MKETNKRNEILYINFTNYHKIDAEMQNSGKQRQ